MNERFYRSDIDGLRALAILGVLLFHIDEHWLPGGFVGVDVFFVISGFLITGIIRRGLEHGSFSLVDFYQRRIRRIFPALLVVLLAVTVAGAFLMLPDDFAALTKSMRYTVLSISNLYFSRGRGYFAADDVDTPLLHMWSLSVEEQFYLVFPLLMIALHRWVKRGRTILWILAGLTVISLVGAEIMVVKDQKKAFFLLPWRAWELLLGGCLAVADLKESGRKVSEAMGFAGLSMIVGSMTGYHAGMTFPGVSAVVPCSGALLLIHAGRNRDATIRSLMGLKPLVLIGLISYSVYLWHWPLVAFTGHFFGKGHSFGAGILAGSLILGWLSWRFIEQPFRDGFNVGRKTVFAAFAVGVVVLCLGEVVVRENSGFPGRFDREALVMAAQQRPKWIRSGHWTDKEGESDLKAGATPVVALWGDSHAVSLEAAMDRISDDLDMEVVSFAKNGYPPFPGWKSGLPIKDPENKKRHAEDVYGELTGSGTVKVVVIAARWWSFLEGEEETSAGEYEKVLAALREAVLGLTKSGKQVIITYPVPEVPLDVPRYCARRMKWDLSLPEFLPESADSKQWSPVAAELLDELRHIDGVSVIVPRDRLLRDGVIRVRDGVTTLYRDDDHLSPAGSLSLAQDLKQAIVKALGDKMGQTSMRK